ncbi:hypothetical protein [Streptomyces sp. WAC 01325]|uniref:hypothetical protein n=1 Tax=Streptomyces sp. WAC 01325 TaxID=2203202 RepID=UPI0021B0153E|nr:hypothetical protein [Streptomyces sp. WAC 01325]
MPVASGKRDQRRADRPTGTSGRASDGKGHRNEPNSPAPRRRRRHRPPRPDFTRALAERPGHLVAALCDPSPTRMAFHNRLLADAGEPAATEWEPGRFADLLVREDIDEVVVTTVDAEHDRYIVPALEAHGGGDPRMLDALFCPVDGARPADPGAVAHPTATERDGAPALAVGLAANRCFESGLPVAVAELVPGIGPDSGPRRDQGEEGEQGDQVQAR